MTVTDVRTDRDARTITLTSESGPIWLSETSRVSNTTVSPSATVSTGSFPASQAKWTRSSGK